MDDSPTFNSLHDLKLHLGGLSGENLRSAFERHIDPAVGVEYRRLFAVGHSDEPLVEIPDNEFPRVVPHPYAEVGAPYNSRSPFYIRQSVLPRLQLAQNVLRSQHAGWSIQVFDAWRPLPVQRYMVEHEFERLKSEEGLAQKSLDADTEQRLWHTVFSIWARPSDDPQLPPPHTTGAALDITLLDHNGQPVDMGSSIDSLGEAALPAHFANSSVESGRHAQANRALLAGVMTMAGFQRHPFEWWHFSFGDQLWALMCWLDTPMVYQTPLYGRVD
jgi:D-alanyl-D-alanine dipeptidase